MKDELTQGRKKSKYAKKIQRKLGRGRPDPRWMWWMDRAGDAPMIARVTAKDIAALREEGERQDLLDAIRV